MEVPLDKVIGFFFLVDTPSTFSTSFTSFIPINDDDVVELSPYQKTFARVHCTAHNCYNSLLIWYIMYLLVNFLYYSGFESVLVLLVTSAEIKLLATGLILNGMERT